MEKPQVRIENWFILPDNRMTGDVYNHPRFEDGTPVNTSSIIEISLFPQEGDVVETRNTLYTLGKPL